MMVMTDQHLQTRRLAAQIQSQNAYRNIAEKLQQPIQVINEGSYKYINYQKFRTNVHLSEIFRHPTFIT